MKLRWFICNIVSPSSPSACPFFWHWRKNEHTLLSLCGMKYFLRKGLWLSFIKKRQWHDVLESGDCQQWLLSSKASNYRIERAHRAHPTRCGDCLCAACSHKKNTLWSAGDTQAHPETKRINTKSLFDQKELSFSCLPFWSVWLFFHPLTTS